ncbi:MAG: CotH kinase family protein [Planctomycetota bacterium]
MTTTGARTARLLWRYSFVLTLPVCIALVWWARTTWQRYQTFRVEQGTLEDFRLSRVGAMTFGELLRRLEVDWTQTGSRRPLPDMRTFDLFVPEQGLARLDADLPHSGFDYVDGVLRLGGDDWRVSVRYRGDNVYHWGYRKKSWRVKTKKARLFEGMRAFNLIAPRTPELLNNYLAYRLANRLGLIAPRVELVEVRVNGTNMGVHVSTEQLDESTLRAQSYMPGDLYSGDAVAQKAYVGIDNDLFRYPGLWEKQAENNHYPTGARAALAALLAVVRAPASEARHERLRQLVDVEAFAAFSALEILCATIHVDTEHNWRLFYDANRRRFVPVVWDLFGWDKGNAPAPGSGPRLDVLSSPLHVVLHADAGFLAARQRVLARFFAGGGDAAFLRETDAAITAATPAVHRDPALTMQVQAFRPAEVRAAMAGLRRDIEALWRDVARAYTQAERPVRFWRQGDALGLLVDGRVPITRLRLLLDGPRTIHGAALRFVRAGEEHSVDVSAAVAVRGAEVDVDLTLMARHVPQIDSMRTFEVKLNRMALEPATYELTLAGLETEHVVDVRCERGSSRLERAVEGAPQRLDLGPMYRVVEPRPVVVPTVWRGEMAVDGVLEVATPLVIEPGTVVRLAPDASVVVRGRVLARGTEAAPIRFEPAGDAPWGVFALQGRGCDGSQFAHCAFREGSGYKTDLFEYSAMLSLHDAQGVVVEHCILHDSRVVDDMMHAVYAELTVRDCRFVASLEDAVDLDISQAAFERCAFERAGNDGLDLMTSRVQAVDCVFRACGDKGISVGEGTELQAERCTMQGCVFGVQVKDGSVASLAHLELVDNQGGIDAYKKNWRYGSGGRVFVYNSAFRGNRTVATADKESELRLRDCAFDVTPLSSRRVLVDGNAIAGPVRRDPRDRVSVQPDR